MSSDKQDLIFIGDCDVSSVGFEIDGSSLTKLLQICLECQLGKDTVDLVVLHPLQLLVIVFVDAFDIRKGWLDAQHVLVK